MNSRFLDSVEFLENAAAEMFTRWQAELAEGARLRRHIRVLKHAVLIALIYGVALSLYVIAEGR